jgi:tetratricopeptide (TPR) repeat protein
VLAALTADAGLREPLRQTALDLARRRQDDPEAFNNAGWSLAASPGRDAEDYLRAVRLAEAACRLAPDNGNFLNTLGVAQYRAGKYAEALDTLTRSDKSNAARHKTSLPADVAFIAMAHHRLGQGEKAQQALRQLRELMKDARWAKDEESRTFVAEAEALLSKK